MDQHACFLDEISRLTLYSLMESSLGKDDASDFDLNIDDEDSTTDEYNDEASYNMPGNSIQIQQSTKYGESLYQEHLANLQQNYPGITVDGNVVTLHVDTARINIYVFSIHEYPIHHSYSPELVDSKSLPDSVSDLVTETFSDKSGPIVSYIQSLTSFLQTCNKPRFKTSSTIDGTLSYEYFSLSEFMKRTQTSRELCDAWGLKEGVNIIVGYSGESEVYVRTCPDDMVANLSINSVKRLPMFALSLIVEDDFKLNFKTLHQRLIQQKDKESYSWVSVRIPEIKGPVSDVHPASTIDLFAIDFCLARMASMHLFCSICHDLVNLTDMAFKPFVCQKDLCLMQMAEFGFVTPLEHVIQHSPDELDLLLTIAYMATYHPYLPISWDMQYVRSAIDQVPSIRTLKSQLDSEQPPSLNDILSLDSIKVMRYVWAVNRSYIKLCKPEERLTNLNSWRQFHIKMTNPMKEKAFQTIKAGVDKPVQSLYAFHGSDAENWFSILATGLNFDILAHGRSYGDGIYMTRDLNEAKLYARRPTRMWLNSSLGCGHVISVNEIINLPDQFFAADPHFVVDKADWVQTRYLLIQSGHEASTATKFLPQDEKYPLEDVNIPVPP